MVRGMWNYAIKAKDIEAVAQFYIDNLDAKVNEFLREINDDPNTKSPWTPFNQRLGRKLFKGDQG